MIYWYYFWTTFFIFAGASFTVVAVIVSIRGVADLRAMLMKLCEHAAHDPSGRRSDPELSPDPPLDLPQEACCSIASPHMAASLPSRSRVACITNRDSRGSSLNLAKRAASGFLASQLKRAV